MCTSNSSDPKSHDEDERILTELTEALCEAGSIERTGACGWSGNLLADTPIRVKSLRWLAAERSSIATLIAKSPNAMSSNKSLVAALRGRYPQAVASALGPVVDRLDIASFTKHALDNTRQLDERIMLLTILGLHAEALPLLHQLQGQQHGRAKLIVTNNIAYSQAQLPDSDLAGALMMAEEVLEEAKDDTELEAMVRDTIALIQMKRGELDSSKENIDAVLSIMQREGIEHPVGHLHCYQIYKKCGNMKLAEHHLRLACKLIGGPQRLRKTPFPSNVLVSEDEVLEIIDEWITGLSFFSRVYDLLNEQLRPSFRAGPPTREREVADQVETILKSAGLAVDRERGRLTYSLKEYVPDFLLPETSTVIEIKYSGRQDAPKRLIAEINDDKAAYLTHYPRVLFVVYDNGFISDIDQFLLGIEEVGVSVLVVKH